MHVRGNWWLAPVAQRDQRALWLDALVRLYWEAYFVAQGSALSSQIAKVRKPNGRSSYANPRRQTQAQARQRIHGPEYRKVYYRGIMV
jgi:hypothetical protein